MKLALLSSYKNKSLLKFYEDETKWFNSDEKDVIQMLGSILKFSHALNISNTNIVESLYFEKNDDKYNLIIEYNGDPIAEEYQTERQKKHIEKIIKSKINLIFTKALH